MTIADTLLQSVDTDRLVVHELTKLSLEYSKISITLHPINTLDDKKCFDFCDAEYKSLIIDPSYSEGTEMTRGIIGVLSRGLKDHRYEFIFRFDDAEHIFEAKWFEAKWPIKCNLT